MFRPSSHLVWFYPSQKSYIYQKGVQGKNLIFGWGREGEISVLYGCGGVYDILSDTLYVLF